MVLSKKNLFIVCLLLLTGCNFHLRTHKLHQPELQNLQLQVNDDDFRIQLQKTLLQSGIKITDTAPYTLKVTNYQILPIHSEEFNTKITNYQLIVKVHWTLTKAGKLLFSPKQIVQQNSRQLLQNTNINDHEFDNMIDKSNKDIAIEIINQLNNLDLQHEN